MTAPKFSANLGFLWRDLPLDQAIRRAQAAGFAAVECHWPYAHDPAVVRTALRESGLPMLALNTPVGDAAAGDFGLAALPGREADARAAIDLALDYTFAIDCRAVHVMAGKTDLPEAGPVFLRNLAYAATRAAPRGVSILVEPLNPRDVPGYFLRGIDHAATLIDQLSLPNIRLMFDCYHQQIARGDLSATFARHMRRIGHVQIAAVPDRGEPDRGEVDYRWLIPDLYRMGYKGMIGAEYRPRGTIEAGLGWLKYF